MQIIADLNRILTEKGIPVLKFSKESGIPEGRVYKWLDANIPAKPKSEDVKKIEQWINSKNLELRQDKASKEPMTYTPISTTDSGAGMAHTAGQDQPQTLQEAVRAFLNVSEAINKQADVLVKLAGLLSSGSGKS